MLREYAVCSRCGEFRYAAIRRGLPGPVCRTCASVKHPRGPCFGCVRLDLPFERHHVAGRRHGRATIPLCLNCHAVMTAKQYGWQEMAAHVGGTWPYSPYAAVFGCIELVGMSWEQANLRTPNRFVCWLSVCITVLAIAGAYVREWQP